jgi:hypothetical protein
MEPNFIEYLTANEHIAYPFAEDSRLLVDTWGQVNVLTPTMPKDFLSDAVILVPSDYAGELDLYRITCVSITEYSFDIRDETGATVISFSVDIATPPPVHSVIQEVVTTPPVSAVRMLTGPSFTDYLNKIGTDLGVGNSAVFGIALPFAAAAVEFSPERVTKVRFKDGVTDVTHDLDETVGLYEGFNVGLTGGESSVEILAEVGAGAGKDDEGCTATPEPPWYDMLTSLQGSKPDDDGNINLKGTPCHRIEPDPENHRVLIYNDCEPCCLCQDYANLAKAIELRFDRLRVVWNDEFLPLVGTVNAHIGEYNSSIFPDIRTFTFWGHVMVGSKEGSRGNVQSSTVATMSLVLTNRCSTSIEVTGTIGWSTTVELLATKAQGTDGGTLELEAFSVKMEPFSELHFYWLVREPSGMSLESLEAEVTAEWTQYGADKTLTRTVK